VGDLDGWPVFPRRMAMVKIKKREAIPEADNRLAKARARGITARRKLMEADGEAGQRKRRLESWASPRRPF
jgi:hypothetical protein